MQLILLLTELLGENGPLVYQYVQKNGFVDMIMSSQFHEARLLCRRSNKHSNTLRFYKPRGDHPLYTDYLLVRDAMRQLLSDQHSLKSTQPAFYDHYIEVELA